jgi:hypothetical protein
MTPDRINGLFELSASVFMLINIIAILKDKAVKGVRPLPTAFFVLWSMWNLYYYPSLDQWFSFIGGISILITNLIYITLMLYYIRKNRGE